MGPLSSSKSSISSLFSLLLSFLINFPKVSNNVDQRRGTIIGQSWCNSSDWCSYPSRWYRIPEVLHLTHYRSWNSCRRSLDSYFRKKCHIPPKDSVLEKGSQLHIRRLQLPYVDRIHSHSSMYPHFLLSEMLTNPPFQLSYKPLGEPDPLVFYLGVAVLLVRLFYKIVSSSLQYSLASTSSLVSRYLRLGNFLCSRWFPCLQNHEICQEFDCRRSNRHP